jgi:hypothetical protein
VTIFGERVLDIQWRNCDGNIGRCDDLRRFAYAVGLVVVFAKARNAKRENASEGARTARLARRFGLEEMTMDMIYLAVTLLFFGIATAYAIGCEKL